MKRLLLPILFVSSLFSKDIIAVLELEQKGLSKQEAEILTDRLTTKLISIDKYQVVERTNMDKILKEQKFQSSGCTDSECAVEIGQLLNTDFIVIGSVSKFGSMYSLDSRLIDVAQGKGLISAEYSKIGEIEILMSEGITSIANQLCIIKESNIITEQTHFKVTSREMERKMKSNETSVENRTLNSYNIMLQKQKKYYFVRAGLASAIGLLIFSLYPSHHDELYDSDLENYYGNTYEQHDFSGYTKDELESLNSLSENPYMSVVLNDWDEITAYNNPIWLLGGSITSLFLLNEYRKNKNILKKKYNIAFQQNCQNKNILLRFSYNL